MDAAANSVIVREVGLCDGLQSIARVLPNACLAGIGDCSHAPGASGNVSTEDVVFMFSSIGVSTGQGFNELLALRAKLATWLHGESLHGSLWRAGLPKTMLAVHA